MPFSWSELTSHAAPARVSSTLSPLQQQQCDPPPQPAQDPTLSCLAGRQPCIAGERWVAAFTGRQELPCSRISMVINCVDNKFVRRTALSAQQASLRVAAPSKRAIQMRNGLPAPNLGCCSSVSSHAAVCAFHVHSCDALELLQNVLFITSWQLLRVSPRRLALLPAVHSLAVPHCQSENVHPSGVSTAGEHDRHTCSVYDMSSIEDAPSLHLPATS